MNSAQFSIALEIATRTHAGINDRRGRPYILHALRIMMRLQRSHPDDLHLMALAVMHDVIEDDSSISYTDLLNQGFSEEFVNDLRLLTHQPGEDYMEYINKMRGNRRVCLVKQQDIGDNSDITRIKGLAEKDLKRMEKYQIAYTMVTGFLAEFNFRSQSELEARVAELEAQIALFTEKSTN